jgi:outer membrane immunogenic protein
LAIDAGKKESFLMKSKQIGAVALSLALCAGSAFAADLPSRKAPAYLPPPPPPPLWTGFYVGLNAGGTWSESSSVTVSSAPAFANPLLPFQTVPFVAASASGATGVLNAGNTGGFLGGGQIGYNWQFANVFVAGLEADIQGVASSRSSAAGTAVTAPANLPNLPVITGINATKSLDYIGTVRGRIGWLVTPTLLVYGTGGLAYGGVNSQTGILQKWVGAESGGVGTPYNTTGNFSDTRVGWTAGGGLEWMFSPNWSAKVEYLYYDLGSVSYSAGALTSVVVPPGGVVPVGAVWASALSQTSVRFDGHIVRAGVNYHFNWGAPAAAVAKY